MFACASPAQPPLDDLLEPCRRSEVPDWCAAVAVEAQAAGRNDLAREAWGLACERGSGAGCREAAAAWKGRGGDPLRVAVHLRRGCELGEISACADLAVLRSEGGDPAGGVDLLVQTCSRPDPRACNDLGVRLVGEPGREELGRSLLKEACRLEVWAACGNLGRLARDGSGETKDLEKGTKLLTIACARGDATACVDVGDLAAASASAGDAELATRMYEQACFQDQVKGCERASAWMERVGVDPNRRARIRARGCALGAGALCDAGSSPGAPLPVGPALGGG